MGRAWLVLPDLWELQECGEMLGALDREEYLATVEQRVRSEMLVMMVMTEVMGK